MRYDMATRVAGQIAVADMKLQDRIQKACALVIAGTTPSRGSAEYNVDQRRHVLGVLDASLGNVSQSMRLLKAIGGAYSTLSRSTISLWVSARSSGESLDPKTRGKAALPEEFLYDIRDNYCITAAREDWIVGDSGRHDEGYVLSGSRHARHRGGLCELRACLHKGCPSGRATKRFKNSNSHPDG